MQKIKKICTIVAGVALFGLCIVVNNVNAASPEVIEEYYDEVIDGANDVYSNDGYIYVIGNSKMSIFKITKNTLSKVSEIDLYGERIIVDNGYAYIVDNVGKIYIIDIRDKNNLVQVSVMTSGQYSLSGSDIGVANDLYVRGAYLYTGNTNGVSVIDVNDKSHPIRVSYVLDDEGVTDTALWVSEDIVVSGNYAYIASSFDDAIAVVDVSDPTSITYVGDVRDSVSTRYLLSGESELQVEGAYLYVYNDVEGFSVFDISSPTTPTMVGSYNNFTSSSFQHSLSVSGSLAYLTVADVDGSGDDGVLILDIENSAEPKYYASIQEEYYGNLTWTERITVSNGKIYTISTFDDFINIIDIFRTPIYRLYNKRTGVHLYTRGREDRDKILNKYSDFEFTDGAPAFYAYLSQQNNLTPIYRLYNKRTGVHLYTRGRGDRDKILNKYSDFEFTDGTSAFYASLTNDGTTPIYRLYNKRAGVHLYTRGKDDRDKVLRIWKDFEFTDGTSAFYLGT